MQQHPHPNLTPEQLAAIDTIQKRKQNYGACLTKRIFSLDGSRNSLIGVSLGIPVAVFLSRRTSLRSVRALAPSVVLGLFGLFMDLSEADYYCKFEAPVDSAAAANLNAKPKPPQSTS